MGEENPDRARGALHPYLSARKGSTREARTAGALLRHQHDAIGSWNGSGFSNTAFATLNMAVLAAIASATVSTTPAVTSGVWRRVGNA